MLDTDAATLWICFAVHLRDGWWDRKLPCKDVGMPTRRTNNVKVPARQLALSAGVGKD